MNPLWPGETVEIRGKEYRVVAVNFDGKVILRLASTKESSADMMMRLQSTVAIDPAAK